MTELKAFLSKDHDGRICAVIQAGSTFVSEPLPDQLAIGDQRVLHAHFQTLIPKMIKELNQKQDKIKKEVTKIAKSASSSGEASGKESSKHAKRSHIEPIE